LARDRNEVRHQVERHCQVADEAEEEQLASLRNARVGDEPAKQHQAVGDEPGERARFIAPAGENKDDDEHRPNEHDNAKPEREPQPRTHLNSLHLARRPVDRG